MLSPALINFALNNVREAAFICDERANFLYVNEEVCRYLGYTSHELLKMGVSDIDPDATPDQWPGHIQDLKANKNLVFDGNHRHKDGHLIPVEINANYIEFENEKYVFALVRNITSRKRTEETLHRLNRELQAITSCNHALTRAQDEQALLNDICRIICEQAGYLMAWVGYAENDEYQSIRPVAWYGPANDYLTSLNLTWADRERGDGPTGIAIRTGKTIYFQDIITDENTAKWRGFALKHGFRSCIAFPLKSDNTNTFGAIIIYSAFPFAFTDEEIKLLEELASDLSFGISILRTRDESKRITEKLRVSEERVRITLEATQIATFDWNLVTDEWFGSPMWYQMLGLEPRDGKFERAFFYERVHPDDKELVNNKIREAIDRKVTNYGYECRMRHEDGAYRWHSILGYVFERDAGGTPTRILGTRMDITERKLLEEERLTHLHYFECMDQVNRVIQNSSDLEQMMSDVLNVVRTIFDSDRASLLYPADLSTDNWQIIVDSASPEYDRSALIGVDIPIDKSILQEIIKCDAPVTLGPTGELPIDKNAADKFDIKSQLATILYPKGDKAYLFCLHQCSSPRTWTENDRNLIEGIGRRIADGLTSIIALRKLIDSEKRYREIFENSSDIMTISEVTKDGRIKQLDSNPAWQKMIGYNSDLVINHFLDQECAPILSSLYKKCLDKKGIVEKDHIVQTPSELWHLHTTLIPVINPEGDVYRIVSVSRNITAQKLAEQEIYKLNHELEQRVADRTAQLQAANRELEAFAYSVSHDLRAPLRHIDGFIELLHRHIANTLDDKGKHYITTVSQSAQRMGSLIDDLLSFSRMGRYELSKQHIKLNDLIQEVIFELSSETNGRNIHWNISEMPHITGDQTLLRTVFINLIQNALKFTRNRDEAIITIGVEYRQAETVIFIRDNGVGYNPEYAGKLFGVFQRLHRIDEFEGTGVGLANVRRIIERHGGRTWAESQLDQGATFYFSLPMQ